MKKIIKTVSYILIITVITSTIANAQNFAAIKNKPVDSQSLSSTEAVSKASTSAIAAGVNKRAVKDFEKNFTSKIQPIWDLQLGNGFVASFTNDGIQNSIYYDKKGNWTYTIKRYSEENMSNELRRIVKPVYYDYKINGVVEILAAGDVMVHLVYLQNSKEFKTLRVCDGETNIIEWFNDGKIMNL